MSTLSLAVVESEARLLVEALRTLEQQWAEVCATSDDPDEIADYGNDLIELRLLLERTESEAATQFGQDVLNTSRELL